MSDSIDNSDGPGPDDPTLNDDTLRDRGGRVGPIPERIGNYVVRRLIASGGMGTVYEALQEQPRRSVAIKVMQPGMFSEAGLHRFEYEAQLLARLRHPGVAQVYEAGTHREGGVEIPFFAMEYIPNAKPITEYAAEKRLTPREKVELFVKVCDAVHHGHQRGIVHRDLKPGNILVDSAGHPKIIDFGVARATDSDMAAAAHQTEVGQIIGSLQYMSPEQFDADPNDIDTRSDVYALGVVLYELLGEKLPYEIHRSRIHEAAALVRESSPVPLGRLDRSLRGDIETIVSCALSKDRDRRYQSAFGLREDLRRYLSGAAIAARAPTFTYQFRVFARRNKGWIAAAAAVLVALVAGGAFSTMMYYRAESARAEAELQAARSQRAVDFLSEMMTEVGPRDFDREVRMSDLIDVMRDRVDVVFAEEPEVASDIHTTIGWASLPLEQYEEFEEHCTAALALRRESLGPTDERTLESLYDVSIAQNIRARNVEFVATQTDIVELCEEKYGPDATETLNALDRLATAYELVGKNRDALAIATDVLEKCGTLIGERDVATISAMKHVARIYLRLNEQEQALAMAQQAYDLATAEITEETRTLVGVRSTLAACLLSYGRLDDAASLYSQHQPDDFGIVKTFQGPAGIPARGPKLLVMWEAWCPFSQRALPIVEDLYRRYQEEGFSVSGLTRVNGTSTDERVAEYIVDQQVSFPMLKDSGKSWSYFEAGGTPFVIMLVDGAVVWKGYVSNTADLSQRLVSDVLEAYASQQL